MKILNMSAYDILKVESYVDERGTLIMLTWKEILLMMLVTSISKGWYEDALEAGFTEEEIQVLKMKIMAYALDKLQ